LRLMIRLTTSEIDKLEMGVMSCDMLILHRRKLLPSSTFNLYRE
jgi:hypothetical protein